ncbi:hypothetical protein [Micropruina sp.]|uniref:hypothetical protein n=1 Tax=Micropruina sp. TaxID=2737536 RepID=UPI0039E31302
MRPVAALRAASGAARDRLRAVSPNDAAVIDEHLSALRAEAAMWRTRYRALEQQMTRDAARCGAHEQEER